MMRLRRGFIGPVGDDIPSIIAILLALGLFFSGVTYSFNSFNDKRESLSVMRGSIEMMRAATKGALIPEDISESDKGANIKTAVSYVAQSYGLYFNNDTDIFLSGDYNGLDLKECLPDDYIVKELVPVVPESGSVDDIELGILVICVRK